MGDAEYAGQAEVFEAVFEDAGSGFVRDALAPGGGDEPEAEFEFVEVGVFAEVEGLEANPAGGGCAVFDGSESEGGMEKVPGDAGLGIGQSLSGRGRFADIAHDVGVGVEGG